MDEYKKALDNYKYPSGESITNKIKSKRGIAKQKDIINEIVLWKINRAPDISDEIIKKLLKIKKLKSLTLSSDIEKVKELIIALLNSEGVRIAMASTILHFYNPKIFPIIDQRAYRELYSKVFPSITKKEEMADLYIQYIKDCVAYHQDKCPTLPFSRIDQILYQLDKDKGNPVKGYGTSKKMTNKP